MNGRDIGYKIGLLEDGAEVIFYSALKMLEPLGVKRLTPLGILYVLAVHSDSKNRIAALTGKDSAQIAQAAKEAFTERHKQDYGHGFFSDEAAEIIDLAVKEADNKINAATFDHLLLALLKMSEKEGNDAKPVLDKLGIKENYVRQKILEAPRDDQQLFSDFSAEVLKLGEPQVDLPSRKNLPAQLLAMLIKQKGANVLLSGEEGSGRGCIVRQMIWGINKGLFPTMKDWKVWKINLNVIRESGGIKMAREAVKKVPPKTIVLADGVRSEDLALVRPFMEHPTPTILIATLAEAKKMEGQDVTLLNRVTVPEATAKETEIILGVHRVNLSKYHGVEIALTQKACDTLIQYGRMATKLALPGAAVQLLDFAAAYKRLTGDPTVDIDDVAQVIAERTGVKTAALTKSNEERLLGIDELFDAMIIGQAEAKTAVKDGLKRAFMGLRTDPRQPILKLLFIGPSGSGKTEMARAIAEFLFDDPDALIQINMTDYRIPHAETRLTGAEPSYVGHDLGGELTNKVLDKPFSVVLLDEVDKAAPVVLNRFMPILDTGQITDGKLRLVKFNHTSIICTSNHFSPFIYDTIRKGVPFARVKERILESIWEILPPELLNRFDAIIVFSPLTKEEQAKILELLFKKTVKKQLKERYDIEVEIDKTAETFILEKGFSPTLGARPLKRAIDDYILTPPADMILKKKLTPGSKVLCRAENGKIVFDRL